MICPECKAGKHPNCDGKAWDFDTDQEVWCGCTHPSHDLGDDDGE